MSNLDQPPNSAQMPWGKLRDWLFKLWKALQNFDSNAGAGGSTQVNGNLAVTGTISTDGGLYLTPYAHRNRATNGAVLLQQYPALVCSNGISGYGPDRFFGSNQGAGGQFTQQRGTLIYNGVTYLSVHQVVNTALTNLSGANYWSGIVQRFEGYNTYDLSGQQITVSFLFQANWTGSLGFVIRSGSGTGCYVQSFNCVANVSQKVVFTTPPMPAAVAGTYFNTESFQVWIGAQNFGTYEGTSSNVWQIVSPPPITESIQTQWGLTAGNTIDVALLQLEVGTVATPFEFKNIQLVSQECLRFYQSPGSATFKGVVTGATTVGRLGVTLSTPMRLAPTVTGLVGTNIYDGSTVGAITSTGTNYTSAWVSEFDVACSGASFVTGRPAILYQQGASITFSAEF